MNLVRNALLLRRTSQRWSVRANINFRPWQQVAKGCGSKRNRKRDAGERGSSCCCCASLYLCVICQFTQILLALLDWNAKSNANLLRVRASWQPLPSPPPPSLRCPLAWVSVNGYSYGFTSARHPWTCHGHGQDIMFAPHIFCLPFARIYINRAPSRWLSFPSPPLPPRTLSRTEAARRGCHVASYQLFSHTVKGFVETCNSRRMKLALKRPDELVATLRTLPCRKGLTRSNLGTARSAIKIR